MRVTISTAIVWSLQKTMYSFIRRYAKASDYAQQKQQMRITTARGAKSRVPLHFHQNITWASRCNVPSTYGCGLGDMPIPFIRAATMASAITKLKNACHRPGLSSKLESFVYLVLDNHTQHSSALPVTSRVIDSAEIIAEESSH